MCSSAFSRGMRRPPLADNKGDFALVVELFGFRRHQYRLVVRGQCFRRAQEDVRVIPLDRIAILGVPVAVVDPDAHNLARKFDRTVKFDVGKRKIGIGAMNRCRSFGLCGRVEEIDQGAGQWKTWSQVE